MSGLEVALPSVEVSVPLVLDPPSSPLVVGLAPLVPPLPPSPVGATVGVESPPPPLPLLVSEMVVVPPSRDPSVPDRSLSVLEWWSSPPIESELSWRSTPL